MSVQEYVYNEVDAFVYLNAKYTQGCAQVYSNA